MATTVRITETYDLKTTLNKIGLIGIHTPTDTLLRKMYPGLMKNHKFIRFLSCDVVGACASVLPADPLQVGVSSGDVAPEDMFNPILMKACTNESFDVINARIYAGHDITALSSVNASDFHGGSSADDQFKLYYSLLAENKRWRKAMPQSGFMMRKLSPICHTLVSTFGNVSPIGNMHIEEVTGDETTEDRYIPDVAGVVEYVGDGMTKTTVDDAVVFRGKSVKMPKIPLHYGGESDNGAQPVNIPKTFVACLVVPPARLHEFYYRMRVSWTVRFEEVINLNEIGTYATMLGIGTNSYVKGYSSSKSEMENTSESVDANDVDITKIMES